MTRRKRRLFLLLGLCVSLAMAAALWMQRLDTPRTDAQPEVEMLHYVVSPHFREVPDSVVQVDFEIQFTFSSDTRISPGSLGKMTRYMQEAETEIATQLARDIEFR